MIKSWAARAAFLTLAFAVMLSVSVAETEKMTQAELDETLDGLGRAISESLAQFDLSEEELTKVVAGIRSGLAKDKPFDVRMMTSKFQRLAAERAMRLSAKAREAGQRFVAEQSKLEGAVVTDSGMVMIVEEPGEGANPGPTDKVKLHYHGTLPDGTVFDSSVDRGTPSEFYLNQVVTCFGEGVQALKIGGKARLICPADLAYGDRGSPPRIKPGATIIFDVELIEILESRGEGS